MNYLEIAKYNDEKNKNSLAKITGFVFLFSLIIPLINWSFILSKFIDNENVLNTANNIMAKETLFRVGITIELVMSVGLVLLAVLLYRILKSVNMNLALIALILKLVEATIMATSVLIPFIALQIQIGEISNTVVTHEQLMLPIGLIFNSHTAITSIAMFFLGLDMMVFSYLFLKSKYIPRLISSFGILSFMLIFLHSLMYIIAPEFAEMPIYQIIFWLPSGLFEIIIGIWLLVKGLKINSPKMIVIQ